MSESKYFTAPISALRSGTAPVEAVENILNIGIVNTGVGLSNTMSEEEYQEALEEAQKRAAKFNEPQEMPSKDALWYADGSRLARDEAETLWNQSLVGWHVHRITGGNRTRDAQSWLKLTTPKEVFFKVRSDILWAAVKTAREENGQDVDIDRRISWREFRILAAILSERTNKQGFAFIGWKTIRARACGYHSRKLFEAHQETLPSHCEPLTISKIYATCDKLEALGFYARHKHSKGRRGGLMAYSFKLERKALIQAVKNWAAANASLKTKVDSFRDSDRESFAK
jgi:hypothetical protein